MDQAPSWLRCWDKETRPLTHCSRGRGWGWDTPCHAAWGNPCPVGEVSGAQCRRHPLNSLRNKAPQSRESGTSASRMCSSLTGPYGISGYGCLLRKRIRVCGRRGDIGKVNCHTNKFILYKRSTERLKDLLYVTIFCHDRIVKSGSNDSALVYTFWQQCRTNLVAFGGYSG